jgi:hypothetical protein
MVPVTSKRFPLVITLASSGPPSPGVPHFGAGDGYPGRGSGRCHGLRPITAGRTQGAIWCTFDATFDSALRKLASPPQKPAQFRGENLGSSQGQSRICFQPLINYRDTDRQEAARMRTHHLTVPTWTVQRLTWRLFLAGGLHSSAGQSSVHTVTSRTSFSIQPLTLDKPAHGYHRSKSFAQHAQHAQGDLDSHFLLQFNGGFHFGSQQNGSGWGRMLPRGAPLTSLALSIWSPPPRETASWRFFPCRLLFLHPWHSTPLWRFPFANASRFSRLPCVTSVGYEASRNFHLVMHMYPEI